MQNIIDIMEKCVQNITNDKSFIYPEFYRKLINEKNDIDIINWEVLVGEKFIEDSYSGLLNRYNLKNYIPFAINNETGEFACFILGKENEGKIAIINAFAPKERLYIEKYNNFADWIDAEK